MNVLRFFPILALVFSTAFLSGDETYNLSQSTEQIEQVSSDVYNFPKPTGKYGVGTVKYHWVDVTRQDPYAPEDVRELIIQSWYPTERNSAAASAGHAETLYLSDVIPHLVRIASHQFSVPVPVINYLMLDIKSYAQMDVPLIKTEEPLPVIILCHGLGSMSALHTAHAENLASHGYVVFGINHTYTCSISIFPDGRMYGFKFDWNSPSRHKELHDIVALWQQDVKFVLDTLKKLVALRMTSNIFYKRLDLDKIGMFGHSMGGATTTQMCRRDERIKAGVNMDGPLFGEDFDQGFAKPYMVMVAGGSLRYTDDSLTPREFKKLGIALEDAQNLKKIFKDGIPQLCQSIKDIGGDAYYVFMKDAGHNTFTDVPLVKDMSSLFKVLEHLGLNTGIIEPKVAIESVNSLLLAFFNKSLLGEEASILDDQDTNPYKSMMKILH